jgi:hypothetical protein
MSKMGLISASAKFSQKTFVKLTANQGIPAASFFVVDIRLPQLMHHLEPHF